MLLPLPPLLACCPKSIFKNSGLLATCGSCAPQVSGQPKECLSWHSSSSKLPQNSGPKLEVVPEREVVHCRGLHFCVSLFTFVKTLLKVHGGPFIKAPLDETHRSPYIHLSNLPAQLFLSSLTPRPPLPLTWWLQYKPARLKLLIPSAAVMQPTVSVLPCASWGSCMAAARKAVGTKKATP